MMDTSYATCRQNSMPPLMLDAQLLGAQGVFIPLPDAPQQYFPLDTVKVSAGFPSPAYACRGCAFKTRLTRPFTTSGYFWIAPSTA